MPIVTNPADRAPKNDGTFDWRMDGVFYISSKVIVGYTAGSDDIYPGKELTKPNCHDTGVHHPGGNRLCYTRPKYRKIQGGPWYTLNSTITTFTSTQAA
jgi:hypothetical protein